MNENEGLSSLSRPLLEYRVPLRWIPKYSSASPMMEYSISPLFSESRSVASTWRMLDPGSASSATSAL